MFPAALNLATTKPSIRCVCACVCWERENREKRAIETGRKKARKTDTETECACWCERVSPHEHTHVPTSAEKRGNLNGVHGPRGWTSRGTLLRSQRVK